MELPTVAKMLTEQLRDDILSGRLAPGDKINEIQLAKDLDVSRSPIREVLRILENERLVENFPRKGTFVTEISLKDFMEVYEIREVIECRAIDVFKKESIRDLSLDYANFKKNTGIPFPSSGSPRSEKVAHLKKMFEFHLKIVEMAGNSRLISIFKGIRNSVLRYHILNLLVDVTPNKKAIAHVDIVEAVNNGDYAKAKKILKAHIKDHSEKIIKKLK